MFFYVSFMNDTTDDRSLLQNFVMTLDAFRLQALHILHDSNKKEIDRNA